MRTYILILLSCLLSISVFSQNINISGVILDDLGEPLPYATVVIERTKQGTMSNEDGFYKISALPTDILTFQYVGYESQTINIKNRTVINVELASFVTAMEEVVVVGYGEQKKESVVGAIGTAKGDDIVKSGGITNVSRAIAGMMPGVVAINGTGAPGEDVASIYIRGRSTWNDSSPLVLVDGVESDMNLIDPHEIESMSVLKDASATAVFGVRGGNGVILITTKRGADSKAKIRFSANSTLKTLSRLPEFEGSYSNNWLKNQSRELLVPLKESVWQSYTSPWELELYKNQTDPLNYPDVDWRSLTVKDFCWQSNYSMDVRGGGEHVKYFTSLAYVHDADLLNVRDLGMEFGAPHNDYSRFNFRSNFDFFPFKGTRISVDISGNRAMKRRSDLAGYNGTNIWSGIYGKASDLHPLMYEDGMYGYGGSKDPGGSNAIAVMGRGQKNFIDTNIATNFRLEQKLDFITKGLVFNGLFSRSTKYNYQKNIDAVDIALKYVDPVTGEVEEKYPWWFTNTPQSWDFYPARATAKASTMSGLITRVQYQTSLNYNRKFGNHNITGLANFKREQFTSNGNFPSFREEWAGRLTYNYDNRYLFETNVAYNGSEKFDKGLMFGLFPSYALGWNVSNESWFKNNIKFIDYLKFRYSTGKVGSDAGINRWLYQSSWNIQGFYQPQYSGVNKSFVRFGQGILTESPYQMYTEGSIANPNATWETAVKNNVAMEFRIFDSRFRASVDYYWNERENIFSSQTLPPWYGAVAQKANIGKTKDSGVELDLDWNDNVGENFRYSIGVNVAYAQNEVIYAGEAELTSEHLKGEGYAIGQVKSIMNGGLMNNWDDVYLYAGSNQNNSERLPGYFYQVDYNGDGYITGEDVVPSGFSSNPEFMYGVNISAGYKRLSLFTQLSGFQNISFWHSYPLWGAGAGYSYSANSQDFENVWLPGREESATMAAPVALNAIGSSLGNQNLADGTTWRLKTVELSYQTPIKIANANLRLYASANNILLWNHIDMDMERQQYGNYDMQGFGRYPTTMTFTFGGDLTF